MRTSILFCLLIISTSLELFGQENLQVLEDSLYYQMMQESMPPLDFPAGAQVDAHEGDSLVLVAFYDSTGGPSTWLDRTGWLQGPVRQWLGISLDASGRVRYIQMLGNRLKGTLPSSLGQLANLEGLHLRGWWGVGGNWVDNEFSGGIPPELSQLENLRSLNLFSSGLDGAIPVELMQLSNLTGLFLRDNSLTGAIPPAIGMLSNLTRLDLAQNSLTGAIPPAIGMLSNLTRLDLGQNKFTGTIPLELTRLTQLEDLDLVQNRLSGQIPPELSLLINLKTLAFMGNEFSGNIPPELGQLTKLVFLGLSSNKLTGVIPVELGQLVELTTLYLHDNNLSGSVPDWTGLSKLTDLILRDNQFLFADLLPNAALSRLNRFNYAPQDSIDTQQACSATGYVFTVSANAEGNQFQWFINGEAIPGEVSDNLRINATDDPAYYHASVTNDALPDLTLFSRRVSTHGESSCITEQYANVADSTLLVDFYNRTHGSLLWHTDTGWLEARVTQWYGITLDASGRVTDVNLPNNNLVGQLPLSQLDQLPNLRRLDVSGNEFSGVIPKGLGDLTQLEYLDLSRNTLAGELPKELAGQAPLKMLDLGGNQLVGTIPTELSQIATLQTFSVSANQLSGPVPAFTGLDQLDTLHVAQNAFLFMDLLPNAPLTRLDDFVYAPQDSIETLLTRTASGFALTTAAKAVGNRYQWYRDDQPISGQQSDTLQVSATSDPAQYHATITNDRLPDLTLVSRKKGVHDGLTLTEGELPEDFLLHQSYPNPFAEATTVAFELGTPEHVRIVVYDLLGKAVATIADGRFTAGVHRVVFTGDHLASGQYMYRMEAAHIARRGL